MVTFMPSDILLILSDQTLKMEADKKAFEKFQQGKTKSTVEAKPKEGVTSERFESRC